MTDRVAGFTVLLTEDWREDDAERLADAMRMLHGVASVTPLVSDWQLHVAETRARTELERRILAVMRGES